MARLRPKHYGSGAGKIVASPNQQKSRRRPNKDVQAKRTMYAACRSIPLIFRDGKSLQQLVALLEASTFGSPGGGKESVYRLYLVTTVYYFAII